jgi:transposase
MPAVPPYIIEPIWQQFFAVLPPGQTKHPLGYHRPRISDRVVFEKLVQVLVFGCAYRRIADEECSATTLRRRRDEWIETGAMDALERIVSGTTIGPSASSFRTWTWTAVSPRHRRRGRKVGQKPRGP